MDNKILKVLDDIKYLLILQLLKSGASTEEIAAVLGITSRAIQQKIPLKKIKRSPR